MKGKFLSLFLTILYPAMLIVIYLLPQIAGGKLYLLACALGGGLILHFRLKEKIIKSNFEKRMRINLSLFFPLFGATVCLVSAVALKLAHNFLISLALSKVS
jgi:hypothetical protein